MARGVRFGVVFAVVFALIAYASGVSERGNALAALATSGSESVTGGESVRGYAAKLPPPLWPKCVQPIRKGKGKAPGHTGGFVPQRDLRKAADMLDAVEAPGVVDMLHPTWKNEWESIKVLAMGSQVVAGTKYRIRFTLAPVAISRYHFEAIVHEPLPHAAAQICGRAPCYRLMDLRECTP
jgi:hypothetical protein